MGFTALINASKSKNTLLKSQANRTLYKYCTSILKPFISNLVSDNYVREEVLQISITKALMKLHSFDAGRSFEAWIKTIARNTVIDAYRNSMRNYAKEKWHEVATAENVEWKDLYRFLQTTISNYPDRDRNVLMKRIFQGYECNEIATQLNLPLGSVLTIIHRFRNKIRQSGLMAA